MITQKNFKEEVLNNTTLSLVQFKSEWRGTSQILAMIYDDLAQSYKGMAKFYTVDFENETALVNEFGITEAPTILFYKDGKIIDHSVGLIARNVLISKIENALSN